MPGPKYRKDYFIFTKEDRNYSSGVLQKQISGPSGYARIELLEGKGSMDISIQNFGPEKAGDKYRVFLIKADSSSFVDAGILGFKPGKAFLHWNFNPDSTGGSGYNISEFEAIAIINLEDFQKNGSIFCPLAAYKHGRFEWKSRFSPVPKNKYIQEPAFLKAEPGNENIIAGSEDNNSKSDKDSWGSSNHNLQPETGSSKEYGELNCMNVIKSKDTTGDIGRLKILLNNSFEACDPFNSRRSDYKWWRTSDPISLNNALYKSNINIPSLFNPSVMMAHFKYRHLIIGVFEDRTRKKELLVFGVPGIELLERRPFSDYGRWLAADQKQNRHGSFGYWVVYLDPVTGAYLM